MPIALRSTVERLWTASPALTATGIVMLALLAGALAGLWLDARTITGAPAWLKPAKFAASVAIFVFTLAWVFTHLPGWPRLRRVVGGAAAAIFIGELAIINVQAWRGTTSHFNVATPFDAALFSAMGLGILLQTLSTVAVAYALWRTTFPDRALGWALRLGLTISIVGAAAGGLMTRPTPGQLEAMQAGGPVTVAGAHTVGAPDGGPGLPGTNWSLSHGDLRVGHFVGLHALQALPLLAVFLRRRRLAMETRVRLVLIAAASYGALFLLLVWQALRGQSIAAPDGLTLLALGGWAAATLSATLVVTRLAPGAIPARTAVLS